MSNTNIKFLFLSFSTLAIVAPASANPLGLDQTDMAFCSEVRDVRVREAASNSQRSEDLRVNTNFDFGYNRIIGVHGDSDGSGRTVNTSSSSRDQAMSNYQSRNCDQLLQAASQVTIAEIDANTKAAIARMQQEGQFYTEDTQRIVAGINLEAIRDTNATNRDIADITAQAQTRIVELQQLGRVQEAQILAETLQRTTAAEQAGQTDRARIEAEALQRIVQDTNSATVEVARVNAQTDQTRSQHQLEAVRVNAQTDQARSQHQLEAVRSNNRTNTTNTVVNQTGQLLGSIINPPSRSAQINARVERERIAADLERNRMQIQLERERIEQERLLASANSDPIAQTLAAWGWSRISCETNLPIVAISGLANEAVCVQPTATMPAGNYSFDATANRLVPIALITSPRNSQTEGIEYSPVSDPEQNQYENSNPGAQGI